MTYTINDHGDITTSEISFDNELEGPLLFKFMNTSSSFINIVTMSYNFETKQLTIIFKEHMPLVAILMRTAERMIKRYLISRN